MAQNSGKRRSKTHNVVQPTPAEVLLESMSGTPASPDLEAASAFQPSSDVSDGEGSVPAGGYRVRAPKKKNYSEQEMEVLVDEVIGNYRTLFPSKTDKCPMVVRSAAWANILVKVNAVGVTQRTVPELKKKWSDMKKKVKAKMAAISRYARQTGGGPSCSDRLTELEEKIGSTCRREQIEGLGLADVCMQALANRETVTTEPTEHLPEEIPIEEMEQPHGEGGDPSLPNQASPRNTPRPNDDFFFPADLGLSEQQSAFIRDYSNEHLQFMRRVDTRFEGIEQGLQNLANAYVSGANTISQGLTKIANLLERQPVGGAQSIHSPSTRMPQALANPHTDDESLLVDQVSPCSISTEHTLALANLGQGNEAESVSSSPLAFGDEDSSSLKALDFSLSKPSCSNFPPSQTALPCASEHPSSAAHFLLQCKKELASPTKTQTGADTLASSKPPLSKPGNPPTGLPGRRK